MPKPFIERKNNAVLDAQELENQGYTDIHFQGHHLTGGTESNKPYNECFFGELDSKGNLIESKPIYYLQGGEDIDSVIARNEMTKQSTKKDSRQSTNSNAKDSNHSNMDSLDCHEAKASRNDDKESISTAFLHPILEDNELKCPHNGISAIICYNIKLAS